jgi:outer membrane biosynthesis protein TonB
MYANGAQGFFDALSIHPYQYTTKFSEGEYDPNVNPHQPWKADSPIEQVIAIRQMMIDNGDEDLRIWATEYGLPTGGPNAVTPEQQAQFIEDFLNAWADLEFAGPSYIYTTRDRIEAVVTEDGSFGLYYLDLTTMQWVAKSAAQVIKDFIEAHQQPPGPEDPPAPDLGTQIAQAIQAFFAQMQAAMQNFMNEMNAFFNSIAQAIAAIFNPGGALAASLPPEVQDEVAEGTEMAAMAAEEDAADAGSDLSESEAATSIAAEVTEMEEVTEPEEVAPETVPVQEPAEAEEVAETPQEPTEEVTEPPATEPEESTDPEESTEEEATETEPSVPAAESDDGDASTSTVTNTESREPVRTGLVARPGKVGADTKDTAGTDDAGDASTADDAAGDADSSGEAA